MRFEKLLSKISKEIPGVRVIDKDKSLLMKLLGLLLGEVFIEKYATTIGRTVYLPSSVGTWSNDDKYRILRHEAMHLRQFRNWPIQLLSNKYLWWVNAFLMGFCYLLVLPVKWTIRAKFEREGYAQSILVQYELGMLKNEGDEKQLIDNITKNFSGSMYLYMWSYEAATKWAQELLKDIKAGKFKNDLDRVA